MDWLKHCGYIDGSRVYIEVLSTIREIGVILPIV